MNSIDKTCPICDGPAIRAWDRGGRDAAEIQCESCTTFLIFGPLLGRRDRGQMSAEENKLFPHLQAATRSATQEGTMLFVGYSNWQNIALYWAGQSQ